MRTVTVVGASPSGLYTARELRAQGFDGRLVIVGDEPHRPYDRPPLSKDFLNGRSGEDQLALSDAEETAELDAEWLLGVRARGLDARGRTVLLDDGRAVPGPPSGPTSTEHGSSSRDGGSTPTPSVSRRVRSPTACPTAGASSPCTSATAGRQRCSRWTALARSCEPGANSGAA